MAEAIISILILVGAAFTLVGSIGLARLPDIFSRLHGPSKATTLGVGAILVAAMVHSASILGTISLKETVVALFLFLTAPLSGYMIARAARAAQKRKP